MNPSTCARAPLLMSTIITAFTSALATSSSLPSGDSATELGVEVGGISGNTLVEICSMGSHESVSNTQTEALLAAATNRRLPSLEKTIAFGWSPTGSSTIGTNVSAANTTTRLPPHSDTYTVFPSGDTAGMKGSESS